MDTNKPARQVAPGALEGIRVLDLTRIIAGPLCTQTLGDLGADVIKVERPGEGDDLRKVGPPWMPGFEGEASTYFQSVNRNKFSITVNFSVPEGADLIRRLVLEADVLIENHRPGTLAKYGLGYDDLRKVNPRLVYCSISGFGQDGPYAPRSGYDYLAQAMAGAMNVTGLPDGVPGAGQARVGIPMADIFAGYQSTVAILAALMNRTVTGEGQAIDVSLFDSQFAAMLNPAASWLNAQTEIGRTGNDHPSAAPYGVFPVDDGHIIIATFNDREFTRLAAGLGHPEWSADDRFKRNGVRVANREALRTVITEALKGRSRQEWVKILAGIKVSCGPINSIRDLEDDPHVQARGMIVTVEHPVLGPVRFPANPFRLSRTPASYRKAPPQIGEDTDAVLERTLGLNATERAALRQRGIV